MTCRLDDHAKTCCLALIRTSSHANSIQLASTHLPMNCQLQACYITTTDHIKTANVTITSSSCGALEHALELSRLIENSKARTTLASARAGE